MDGKNIQELLEEAISQRGRYYSNHFSFSIRFGADNTSAVRDTVHFQNLLKILHLPRARELVLPPSDKSPSWTVSSFIHSLATEISKREGRTLVIGHYAGHATLGVNDNLSFFASPSAPKSFGLEKGLGDLYQDYTYNNSGFEMTDVVLILDSCYSAQATRGFEAASRSVEIICSVGTHQKALGNASDLARVQNRTFTSRLADSVAQSVSKGDSSSVSFVEIVEELRGKSLPERLPEYSLHVGRVGIRVPILGQARLPPHLRAYTGHRQTPSGSSASEGSSTATPETSRLTAVFSAHLGDNPSSEEVKKLVEWVHALNPAIGLELTGIHRSQSTVLVMVAPWHIWAQLKGLPGLALVCNSFGQNMLPSFLGQRRPIIGKENEPLESEGR
ncbi:MAG: hypothetical protein M1839_000186 [Geoglossum umbratile]|nr:MAG: hypothetical protein M1839_000186 [Geoglossum umbratile]